MQKLQKKSEDDEDDEDEDEMEAEDDFGIVPHKMMNNEFYKNKNKKTERDLEVELDVDYAMDFNKRFDLKNEEEKYDVIPEHWHGHNIGKNHALKIYDEFAVPDQIHSVCVTSNDYKQRF